MSRSQGGRSGPQGGQATGQRDGGSPEQTKFQRDHLRDKDLDPAGGAIGSFPFDGPAPRGDVTVEKATDLKQTVQLLAEEVEKEPLPVEYKDQIRRFHSLLLGDETEE